MNDKRITIKDIARLTKVSSATVSLVINNKPGVGKETRERVLSVATALNFTPNIVARSLVTQRSNSIAMMITTLQNSVFSDIAAGVHGMLRDHGYLLSIIPTSADEKLEANEIEAIRARGYDGVITSATLLNNENAKKLASIDLPVVWVLRRYLDENAIDYVGTDDVKMAYLATEHLIRLGHRNIGIIKGPPNTSTGLERLDGALKAFQDYGIIVSDDLIQPGDYLRQSGHEAAEKLLRLPSEKKPTAIFAVNDDMAFGAFDALIDMGLSVPADVALVGAGNVEATSFRALKMTTVSQQNTEMGRMAAKRLIDRIENPENLRQPFHVTLEPELIIRESCGFHLVKQYPVVRAENRRI